MRMCTMLCSVLAIFMWLALAMTVPVLAQQGTAAAPAPVTPPSMDTVQGAPQQVQSPAHSAGDFAAGGQDFPILRTMGGLALVICLIIAGVMGGKKFLPHYFTKKTGDKQLKLLESLAMGDKRSVALIQVDDKILLVGNTPQQITLLADISGSISLATTPELAPHTAQPTVPARTNGDSFRSLYEVEKKQPSRGTPKVIPPDVRAKMRQLRDALEH